MNDKLVWTKTPPTEAGFYFYRSLGSRGTKKIDLAWVMIIETPDEISVIININDVIYHLQNLNGEWAGPIPNPVEAAKNEQQRRQNV